MTIRHGLATLALILGATASAGAQSTSFGVLGGLTSSKVTVDGDQITVTLDSRTGFAGGLASRTPLGGQLGLEVDALYAQKGFKISDGGDSAELKLGYIDVPVLLRYGLTTSTTTSPFLLAGGTVSFKASCDVGSTSGGVSASASCKDVTGDDQKSVDVGLTVGGGVDFNRFTIQARYTIGMTDILDDGDGSVTTKNRALFLLAGIMF